MNKKIWILFLIVFYIVLFSNTIFSTPSPFEEGKTCSDIFGNATHNCSSVGINDTCTDDCIGVDSRFSPGPSAYVEEVYINASYIFAGEAINVTCQFNEFGGGLNSEYLWYYNRTDWIRIANWSIYDPDGLLGQNKSVIFNVNLSEGTHIVRCLYSYNSTSNETVTDECANGEGQYYDNDDVNFTVTSHLRYDFWNLTNYTDGSEIANNQNFFRDSLINVSAHWNKTINNANITHNGTGSFENYTISDFTGNWTNYTLNLSNSSEFNIGLINISSIWANDTYSATNSTSPDLYFYLWGFSKVSEISLNQSTVYNASSVQAFCKVIDNYTSSSIGNYNVSFYKNESFLNSSLTNSSGYANVSFVDNVTNPPQNYTIKCNITDEPSLYYNASDENSNNTNLTVLSSYEIQVGDFWFVYNQTRTNSTNLFTNLTIYANVSDALAVSGVYANLSYPSDAIIINLSMTGDNTSAGWNLWNYTFNNSEYPLNTTGNYTVNIIANNSNGIENVSSYFLTFYVTNNYTLNLTSNYTVYMRGENVTIQALDINNFTVDNASWVVNVTKINETYNFTPSLTTFNYTILPSDLEGNYSIIANASKDNNTGNNTWNFTVSRLFNIIDVSVTSLNPSPSSLINVQAHLNNSRGVRHNESVNGNIFCINASSRLYQMFEFNFTNGSASLTGSCIAHSDYNTAFNITINVSDTYNNTGQYIINLTTTSATVTFIPSGGGSFTLPTKEKEKNCTDGTSYNQCSAKRPFYCSNGTLINYCSVCGCEPGYGCQPDESCILTKKEDFVFNLNVTRIDLMQGEDKLVSIGYLENTGNTILNLLTYLNVSEDCCNISMPSSFELREKDKITVDMNIHVPLYANVSEYLMKIGIGTQYFKNEKNIDIIVRKSPYYNSLSDMETELENLEKEIQEYKNAGIDTSRLEALIQQSKISLYNANDSISTDQVSVLKNSLSDLKNNIDYTQSTLTTLRTQRFLLQHGWLIGLLLIMSITTMYMVPQVCIPLYKKEKELLELKSEEEALVLSRVETEKQYFMRKIDSNTFNKIMIEKQDKILKLRAMIKERDKERTEIIKKVSLVSMFGWFGRGVKNIPMHIKNAPKRILKRKNKNNIDKNGKTE
jgi:hypothetical protein